MGLLDDCESYFGTRSLYEVLSVDNTASAQKLQKAYRKASLFLHPDKQEEDKREEYTRKFQVLSKVHFILSDKEKRDLYDETGIIDDENAISVDDSSPDFWSNYWRTLFPVLTVKDIEDFFVKYRGSEEERNDLKSCYVKLEGDMNKISEYFIGYHINEEERFCKMLNEMIKTKELPSFPKFVNETRRRKMARRKKFEKEATEVEDAAHESLLLAMAQRSKERERNFNDMVANLEAKYGKEKGSGSRKKKKL